MTRDTDKTCPFLNLSNLVHYNFQACDEKAGVFIAVLARVMKLKKGNKKGREVLVYVSESSENISGITFPENETEPIICSLQPAHNHDMFNIQVQRIAQAIAADVISKGGALIHGGLCAFKGYGAVMAGAGNTGKTTASRRLPVPWTSYSDDSTLIVPHLTGGFRAHPWPTWSRFYEDGPGGKWDVERSLLLKALFFLKQSETDCIEPVDKYQAKAMLIDTIEHVTRLNRNKGKEKKDFIKRCFQNSNKIVSEIPAYRLWISLEGKFWKEMEKVMLTSHTLKTPETAAVPSPAEHDPKKVHFIYRGSSMNPTFYEPELLTLVPYHDREPKKGDIICYRFCKKNEGIVHRIIAVKGTAIKTRGDNSACPDDYTVGKTSVIGRVVASRRGNKTRTVYSGELGLFSMHFSRFRRKFDRLIAKLLNKSYCYLADSGIFRKLKLKNMIFKVVVFGRPEIIYPKLILKGRTVGTYDFRFKKWIINRPYRLFVDKQNLPVFELPE